MDTCLPHGWLVKALTDHINHEKAAFIRAHTVRLSSPLVPEITLYLAEESIPLWQKTEEELQTIGVPPPFWAFAWAGGQGLARYILDHPQLVAGKRILDFASGSGLVAIAAMKAGAHSAIANDIDDFAATACLLNAAVNNVTVSISIADLIGTTPEADLVLAGDIFYEQNLAQSLLPWFQALMWQGVEVLLGDPGRTYLPFDALEKIASYRVPVSRDLEDALIKQCAVWRPRRTHL